MQFMPSTLGCPVPAAPQTPAAADYAPPRTPDHLGFGTVIQSLRMNRLTPQQLDHTAVFIKRRSYVGRHLIPVANWFFRAAGAPVAFWSDTATWQEWEVQWFRRLNPGFDAHPLGESAILEQTLPGQSLWTHLQRHTLTLRMVTAAAREYARAHALHSPYHHGPWSHGDAAMNNVIYDPHARRARLIDFELAHHPDVPASVRHADDLLAFLTDLLSVGSDRRWRRYTLAFVDAYGDPIVLAELRERLATPPTGLARLWWKVRTNFLDPQKVTRRVAMLRDALDQPQLWHGRPAHAVLCHGRPARASSEALREGLG